MNLTNSPLKRLLVVITSPVWIPAIFVALILSFIYLILLVSIGALVYWIVTGRDIMHSRFNILGI